MATVNNPKLGDLTCSTCGQAATVHQSSRGKGRWLYTRGCECKCRQSSGATFQNDIWKRATWLDGAKPIKPSNIAENPDFDPNAPRASEIESSEPATPASARPAKPRLVVDNTGKEPKRKPVGWAVLGAVMVGVVVAIFASRRVAP